VGKNAHLGFAKVGTFKKDLGKNPPKVGMCRTMEVGVRGRSPRIF